MNDSRLPFWREGSRESGRSDGYGMAHSQPFATGSGRAWSGHCGQAANDERHSLGVAHGRALGLPPTRNMPSIPQLCGRTNMPPAQKGESKSGSARPLARRLLHENPPSHDPLTFDVTGGEVHEVKGYDALMQLHEIDPAKLIGDKGYDSDGIRNDLAERGIEPVIPPRSNRKTPIEYDREAYKRRNLIERCVNRLKQFRRIATRYEKTARAA